MGAADNQQQHQHAQQPPTSTAAPALPPLTPINVNDRRASIARTVDLATGEASPVTSAGWHRRFSVGEYYGRDGGSGVRATPSPGPTLFPVAEASGRSSATAGAPPPGYMIVDLDRDGADATDAHHFQQKLLALGLSTKSSRAADRVRGFFAVRRNRYLCCGALSFIVLTVLALFITFYAVVPGYFQETFSTFSTNVAWPPVDFNLLLEERIHFNTSTTMGFTNIVDTRIIFQEPMRFSTDNILVATMELPAIDFGPGRRYQLNHNFTLELANVTKWESLWKRWIGLAITPNEVPREWLENYQDTYWTLESTITIEMAGLRWTNIPITKEMIYNGGLSARNSPVTVQVANSDLYGGLNEPGLRLQLQLNNTAGLVGIHAGDLRFDVASAYSRNKTQRSQELVKLLSVRLPDFKYVSGVSNITIENNVELGSLKQLRAAAQLGTNYLANRTSTIMLRGFHAHYAWMPEEGVSWVNNVLGTLAFIVQVNRPQSLGGMMMDKANRSWAGVTTSFTSLVNDNPWMNDGYLTTDGMRTAGPPVSAKSEAAHDLAASSDFRPEFTLEDAKALLRGDLSVDKNGSVVATR